MATKQWSVYALCGFILVGFAFLISCSTTQAPNSQVQDSKITTEVKSKIASDVRLSSLANVSVNTTNGVVTLAGEVENEHIRQTAEAVAHEVPGVVRVNNELQTQFQPVGGHAQSSGTNPEDKAMAVTGTNGSPSSSSQNE